MTTGALRNTQATRYLYSPSGTRWSKANSSAPWYASQANEGLYLGLSERTASFKCEANVYNYPRRVYTGWNDNYWLVKGGGTTASDIKTVFELLDSYGEPFRTFEIVPR